MFLLLVFWIFHSHVNVSRFIKLANLVEDYELLQLEEPKIACNNSCVNQASRLQDLDLEENAKTCEIVDDACKGDRTIHRP